ncbi:MAG: PQQ-binding-like beta-propeller repeat protein, partial [Acidobacteriota bacterium]|nr:PQQ-binding-like beta-propeller repeat protein [Acidobacteriota bacterium]
MRCVFSVLGLFAVVTLATGATAQTLDDEAVVKWSDLFTNAPREKRTPSTLLPLQQRWSVTLTASPVAAPVAGGDRVFVALADGHIVAVDLSDGSELWQVMQMVEGQPTAGGGMLYAASRTELRALNFITGGAHWVLALDAGVSAPLVWNAGWLIVALENNTLLAIRAESGEILWEQQVDGAVLVPPALAGDRMYVSLESGQIRALQLLTGKTVWERTLDGAPQQILPLDDLFVGTTGNYFYRLSKEDGTTEWRWRTGGDVVGLPAVDEHLVFFASLDNVLWALDRRDGGQQWRQTLPVRPISGPRHAGDLILQGGRSTELTLFSREDGTIYGAVAAPSESELVFSPSTTADPARDGRLLVMVAGDGQLQAVGGGTGPVRLDPAVALVLSKNYDSAGEVDAASSSDDTPGTAPAVVIPSPVIPPP